MVVPCAALEEMMQGEKVSQELAEAIVKQFDMVRTELSWLFYVL